MEIALPAIDPHYYPIEVLPTSPTVCRPRSANPKFDQRPSDFVEVNNTAASRISSPTGEKKPNCRFFNEWLPANLRTTTRIFGWSQADDARLVAADDPRARKLAWIVRGRFSCL